MYEQKIKKPIAAQPVGAGFKKVNPGGTGVDEDAAALLERAAEAQAASAQAEKEQEEREKQEAIDRYRAKNPRKGSRSECCICGC